MKANLLMCKPHLNVSNIQASIQQLHSFNVENINGCSKRLGQDKGQVRSASVLVHEEEWVSERERQTRVSLAVLLSASPSLISDGCPATLHVSFEYIDWAICKPFISFKEPLEQATPPSFPPTRVSSHIYTRTRTNACTHISTHKYTDTRTHTPTPPPPLDTHKWTHMCS